MKSIIYPIVFLLISLIAFAADDNGDDDNEVEDNLVFIGYENVEDFAGLVVGDGLGEINANLGAFVVGGGGGRIIDNSCSTAGFCGGSYEIECSAFSDDVCPEDFGNWGSCGENNHGGSCTPCDPDCGDCGQGISLDVPNLVYPGQDTVNIGVNAFGYTGRNQFVLHKQRMEDFYDHVNDVYVDCYQNQGDYICPGAINNVYVDADVACETYTFRLRFYHQDEMISTVFNSGMVSPNVEITSHESEEVINGTVELTSDTTCFGGSISMIIYALCPEEEETCYGIGGFGGFYRQGEEPYSLEFDTTDYLNGNYTLAAWVIGEKQGMQAEYINGVEITINNEPGVGQSYEGSRVLNIVLARIKTWL
tara:strand:- start:4231 stop:5322 length:1092 start_codon:yes stop_codon:yes gene_type:complete